ncbi:MAG: hypothetical protein EBV06_00335 [Planctomycetia bacterium]|nr:hypothetical protein [Planctomycetia bacterium]
MRKEALLICTLLALATQTKAESYTIKVKPYPSSGKSFAVKVIDRLEASQTLEEKGKPAQTVKSEAVRTDEYNQSTLTVEGGKLATFQRVYTASTVTSGDKTEKTIFDGKKIQFTFDKKQCKHDLKDEKLSPDDNKKLTDAHTDGLAVLVGLLPDKPINEGDEWPLTGKQIVSGLVTVPVDPERSRGKGKLVKVTKRDGVPIGTIEIEIDVETVAEALGKGKGKFVIKAETPIDGSATQAKMSIKGSLTIESEEKGTRTKVVAGGELSFEISEEK